MSVQSDRLSFDKACRSRKSTSRASIRRRCSLFVARTRGCRSTCFRYHRGRNGLVPRVSPPNGQALLAGEIDPRHACRRFASFGTHTFPAPTCCRRARVRHATVLRLSWRRQAEVHLLQPGRDTVAGDADAVAARVRRSTSSWRSSTSARRPHPRVWRRRHLAKIGEQFYGSPATTGHRRRERYRGSAASRPRPDFDHSPDRVKP